MSMTAEQIAEEGKLEFVDVLVHLLGGQLTFDVKLEKTEAYGNEHWILHYTIRIAEHLHSNSGPISSKIHGGQVLDFREGLLKRALGDLGRGLLDIVRKGRDDKQRP